MEPEQVYIYQMLMGLQANVGQICFMLESLNWVWFSKSSVLDARANSFGKIDTQTKQYKECLQVESNLDITGLSAFVKQPYRTLSGGQKRRVDIARALLNSPDLLS